MHELSDRNRSVGFSQTSGEIGNFTETYTSKNYFKDLIVRANKIPINQIFKLYNIKIAPGCKLITCPFKFHKGGKERTPSFEYYPQTNTFYCHGCTAGTRPVDFVSKMDNVSKVDAAHKILNIFDIAISDYEEFIDPSDAGENLDLIMEFSLLIKEFRDTHFEEKDFKFIEHICETFDTLNFKHKIENDGLRSLLKKFKQIIGDYV